MENERRESRGLGAHPPTVTCSGPLLRHHLRTPSWWRYGIKAGPSKLTSGQHLGNNIYVPRRAIECSTRGQVEHEIGAVGEARTV